MGAASERVRSAHSGTLVGSAPRWLKLTLWLLVASSSPTYVAGQYEVSTGLIVVPQPSVGGTQVGPLLAVAVSRGVLGVPLFLEMSAARTDFTSLGQSYHHNHYSLTVGGAWFPIRGATSLGLRLGLGAYGEYEVVETEPASPGGDSWVEAVVPALVLGRELGGGKRLVLGLSDSILGPYFAVLDPSEYGIEHRLRVMLGVRF